MQETSFHYHLVLGSASPRRAGLLRRLGCFFTIAAPGFTEERLPGESPEVYVRRNAAGKAAWIAAQALPVRPTATKAWPYLVVSADTIVVLDDDVLEKPRDEADAVRMLGLLSGRRHRVLTGVCLYECQDDGKALSQREFVCATEVEFKTLTDKEIAAFVATGEPLDKAGAYGVQGAGSFFVRAVYGSYTNVVGLPLCEVYEELARRGLSIPIADWKKLSPV